MELAGAVGTQRRDCVVGERDASLGGAGLDVAEVEAGAVGFESVGDGEGGFGGVEVEVGPGDAEEFAGAQATSDRDDECGVECGAFSSGDEVSGLLGGEGAACVGVAGWAAGNGCDVAGEPRKGANTTTALAARRPVPARCISATSSRARTTGPLSQRGEW